MLFILLLLLLPFRPLLPDGSRTSGSFCRGGAPGGEKNGQSLVEWLLVGACTPDDVRKEGEEYGSNLLLLVVPVTDGVSVTGVAKAPAWTELLCPEDDDDEESSTIKDDRGAVVADDENGEPASSWNGRRLVELLLVVAWTLVWVLVSPDAFFVLLLLECVDDNDDDEDDDCGGGDGVIVVVD